MFICAEEMKTSLVGDTAEWVEGCIMSPEHWEFVGTSGRKARRHWRVRPLGGPAPMYAAAACVLKPRALICPWYQECALTSLCIVMCLPMCVWVWVWVHANFNLRSDKSVHPGDGKYACCCACWHTGLHCSPESVLIPASVWVVCFFLFFFNSVWCSLAEWVASPCSRSSIAVCYFGWFCCPVPDLVADVFKHLVVCMCVIAPPLDPLRLMHAGRCTQNSSKISM